MRFTRGLVLPIVPLFNWLEIMKEFGKPIIIYLSKTDLLAEEKFKSFAKKNKAFDNAEDLKQEIIKMIPKKEVGQKEE